MEDSIGRAVQGKFNITYNALFPTMKRQNVIFSRLVIHARGLNSIIKVMNQEMSWVYLVRGKKLTRKVQCIKQKLPFKIIIYSVIIRNVLNDEPV